MGRTSILSGQNRIGFNNIGAVYTQCWTCRRQWKLGSATWIIVLCVIWSTGQLTAHELPCWTPVGHNLTYHFAPKFHAIRQVESGTRNLRIAVHYTHALKSLANFPAITEKLLLPAIKFWTDALAAKNPQVSNLLFSR
ncbi:unnamed protein product [Dicrocoelium dendriticum]|nr:unnamed protein product [Dicrocoelium dendriticum]